MTLRELSRPVLRTPLLGGLPVAIIGAGPVGLAAAAHLFERGIDFRIYEAGASAANSVAAWKHVRLFSPWRFLIDPAARRLLATTDWVEPDADRLPAGAELIERYLAPLASLETVASRTHTRSTVVSVSRQGMDRTRSAGRSTTPFVLRIRTGAELKEVTASAVIDASGTYASPNGLSSNGLEPLGADRIAGQLVHALPDVLGTDRARFAGRHTTVVGAGHSAANTLIALAKLARGEPATRVTWVVRRSGAARVSASPDDDLQGRASIGARVAALVADGEVALVDRFEIARLRPAGSSPGGEVVIVGIRRGEPFEIATDNIVGATGFRPDLSMLREIRLDLDDIVEAPRRLAPMIDPNLHSCGTAPPHGFVELRHPEPNFFIVGMKSYGRAPTFLLGTGYEQVRSIVAWLSGDVAAATAVQLVLPATGVCSTDDAGGSGGGCCA
ncbi:thioredoxin reductase [Marisediminicola sp. UYEF4]|uniref:NAD(P)-binding domain-containing protein n=1 Tax=Marisediminicola sp. UYEF4 TaxID=1756384 RepID=UPI003399EDE5